VDKALVLRGLHELVWPLAGMHRRTLKQRKLRRLADLGRQWARLGINLQGTGVGVTHQACTAFFVEFQIGQTDDQAQLKEQLVGFHAQVPIKV
jgi:hypothetical protein